MGYRDYSTAKGHIVDATGHGDFTTIGAALSAATSGETIFIRPGTYTENPALITGVDLVAFETNAQIPTVIIHGECTFSSAGSVGICGIQLETNSNYALSVTGSAASVVYLESCFINCTNNTGINHTSSSSSAFIYLNYCYGNLTTTGIAYFACNTAGQLLILGGRYQNTGGSTTANTFAGSGFLAMEYIQNFPSVVSTSGTSTCNFTKARINGLALNTTAYTTSSTGAQVAFYSHFDGGSASAISVGSGATFMLDFCDVSSTNTNAITGSGTIEYGLIVFTGASSGNNVTTQTALKTQPSIAPVSGTVIQQKRTSSTTATSTTTQIALTGTTPTTSNTVSLISRSVTPTSVSNTLIFDFSCPFMSEGGDGVGFYLFAGSTLLASFPYQTPGTSTNIVANASFRFYATSGTTSTTTYAVYYSGLGSNAYILQNTGSTAFFNGNVSMEFIVTEVVT